MYHSISSIAPLCDSLHQEGKTIVLATGFFDLLHDEHINFLQKAKGAGDVLIVAVESDIRARTIKGEGRPIEAQAIRCQKVSVYADYVIALPDDFDNPIAFESLISAVKPNFLAISSHTAHQDKKQALVSKYGGQLIVVHHWSPDVSTTQIINGQMV